MNKTKTINKTKTMTTLHFSDGYRSTNFLGLDARPENCNLCTEAAIASPAQIVKINRAIADGVRVEVKFIKGKEPRPNTVRVHTYGTHKAEVRQDIQMWIDLLVRECLSAVDSADWLASNHANPLPPRFHKERVLSLERSLKWLTEPLSRRVCGYVDPAFMKYPKRGRKSPSTV